MSNQLKDLLENEGSNLKASTEKPSSAPNIPSVTATSPAASSNPDLGGPERGGFGNKETKKGRALGITVEISDTFKRIDLICMGGDGEEELKCAVSKRNADEWLPKLEALDRLSEKHIEKIRAAFAEKKAATFLLSEGEQFGVKYWTTDDGKAFLDTMTPEAPPAKEPEKSSTKGDANHA